MEFRFSTNAVFLLLAFVTAASVSPTPVQTPQRKNDVRVIVIGAGTAGIAAASKLASTGQFNVTLLEAADRIGGRTHSLKFGDLGANHIEMGGEWIHGEVGNSVFELVSPLGLVINKTAEPLEFGDQFGLPNGEILNQSMSDSLVSLLHYMWHDPEGWGDDFAVEHQNKKPKPRAHIWKKNATTANEEEEEEETSMGEWARWIMERFNEVYPIHSDSLFMEVVYDWAHRITNAEDASDNWFEKSASDEGEQYVELEGFANVPWKPPYSYTSLHQLLLTGNVTENGELILPDWIQLNKVVSRIEYSTTEEDQEVTVFTEDGSSYTADHVIFTPSLGVLKANHLTLFDPPLSEKKQLAINNIGFGSATKLYYEFHEPWWPPNYEGTFLLWDDHDYNYDNHNWTYWRQDITREELLAEFNGFPLWCRSILNIFTVDSGSHPNMMRIWITGLPSRFLDNLSPAYVDEWVLKIFHQFLDAQFPNITEPIGRYQSTWGTNRFTMGVYSYRTLASEELDVWARDLAEPILADNSTKPILCFAGEATHPTFFSTVHGAMDTGVREFERLRDWYNKT